MNNTSNEINSVEDANRKAVTNTIFSPRFYTTDFEAMDKLNIEPVRAEWNAMMAEYEGDNNHDHFQRDAAFADEARDLAAKMSPELRQEFLFSGQFVDIRIFRLRVVQRNQAKCH